VLAGAARGDDPAVAAVEHVADHFAIGLAAIVNTLNPRLIVLGGFSPTCGHSPSTRSAAPSVNTP
jgi:predicted NBD/HSP70 family sugar kinase